MLASSGLREESVEGVVPCPDGLVRWHLPIRLDPVLQAVELPASIANLATSLANVDRDTLTLQQRTKIRTCNILQLYRLSILLSRTKYFLVEF